MMSLRIRTSAGVSLRLSQREALSVQTLHASIICSTAELQDVVMVALILERPFKLNFWRSKMRWCHVDRSAPGPLIFD